MRSKVTPAALFNVFWFYIIIKMGKQLRCYRGSQLNMRKGEKEMSKIGFELGRLMLQLSVL